MAVENNQNIEQESENSISIKDILMIGLKKWPWLVLSVCLCMGLATLYLMRTVPAYTRTASIRIKKEAKGSSISSDLGFSELGFFKSYSNVVDEMTSLQSTDFMKEVVKRLNLTFNYTKDGRFHDEVVYGKSLPVMVMEDSISDDKTGSFKLHVSPDGEVTI